MTRFTQPVSGGDGIFVQTIWSQSFCSLQLINSILKKKKESCLPDIRSLFLLGDKHYNKIFFLDLIHFGIRRGLAEA